jgi:hypothetical protein
VCWGEKLGRFVESVHHDEDDLALRREQARADGLMEQRVHSVGERPELALIELAEVETWTGTTVPPTLL